MAVYLLWGPEKWRWPTGLGKIRSQKKGKVRFNPYDVPMIYLQLIIRLNRTNEWECD
jgi:hypothetical protein